MKALIAMSGGVDSSMAAAIVQSEGYDCVGCTMKLYDSVYDSERRNGCCTLTDTEDARSVARRLSMPYYVFNFKDSFEKKVIQPFIDSYLKGHTPNPCIECNRLMKFDKLFDRAGILGCDFVVTGHYARIEMEKGRFVLKKAVDKTKDQSYVLYFLTQAQLARILFPLGSLKKADIRKKAEELGFLTAQKPDSQDICFVDDNYADFIEQHENITCPPGDFIDLSGQVLGRHNGIIRYTIGQRKGLGISSNRRLYVYRVSPENNTVTLGDNDDLYNDRCIVDHVNWISGEVPTTPFSCRVKVRYRQQEQPASVIPNEDGSVAVVFNDRQRAITPGQAAVFYDGDTVLGGGTIVSIPS